MPVDNREFYVYRYEGKLKDVLNAVVVISYPKETFSNSKALTVFIFTNADMSIQEILDTYTCQWAD